MLPSLHVHPYRLVRCISIFNVPSLKCTNKIATWAINGEKERERENNNKSWCQNICACNLCSISQMHGKERKTKYNENHFDMQDPRQKFVAHNFANVCYEKSKSNSASARFLWHRFGFFFQAKLLTKWWWHIAPRSFEHFVERQRRRRHRLLDVNICIV